MGKILTITISHKYHATTTRVAIYNCLKERIYDVDALEMATRRILYFGLEVANKKRELSSKDMDEVFTQVLSLHGHLAPHSDIIRLMLDGVVSKGIYANQSEHPLGYSALNGHIPFIDDVIDVTLNRHLVKSIEFFTDGYMTQPPGTTIGDWENEYHRIEQIDRSKTTKYMNIKGSTSTEFFDDRSIISVLLPG